MVRAFGIGLLAGALTGLVAVEVPIVGILLVVVLVVAAAWDPRRAALGGALVSLGCVWTLLALKAVVDCTPTGNQCGQTPILPFAAVALAALATGVVTTALAVRAGRESGR